MIETPPWTDKEGRNWPKTLKTMWIHRDYNTRVPYNVHERIDIEPDGEDRLSLCAMSRYDDTQWSDEDKECIWIFKEWVPEIIKILQDWAKQNSEEKMTVKSLSMCKVLCKDCKYRKAILIDRLWFPDQWKCKASPKGYRCTDGKSDGYALCRIVNDKGNCELFEPK